MPQRVQEGVEVKVQFVTQSNWSVPDVVRERRFTTRAQYIPMAVWGPEMHKAVAAKLQGVVDEVNKDPTNLSPVGRAWMRFVKATGGKVDGNGKAEVGDGSLSLAALQFVRHGASVTAIIPHPLEKSVEAEEQGFRKASVQKLAGIWVTPAVWKKSVTREDQAGRIKGLLKPGEKPTKARSRELYDELPPGDYYWYFFIPKVFNGESVDIVEEMKRLGAILNIEALYAIESSDDLAQLPSLRAEAEGMRKAMLEMERRHESLQAALARSQGREHDLEQRLHEKAKPIHEPQPVAVKPLPGQVPWNPMQQEAAEKAKTPRRFPSVRPFILPIVAVVGIVISAYFGTVPAAQATQQTSLGAASGAVLAVFSVITSVILWARRRGAPSPKAVQAAQTPEVP
ncbi:MAG: hypothetical protein KGI26_04845 [Thaumarchaeota archaeon]|nr:hypothetical protein [Nitrososphaerota archaeon]